MYTGYTHPVHCNVYGYTHGWVLLMSLGVANGLRNDLAYFGMTRYLPKAGIPFVPRLACAAPID
jgi:hypothetical protein